jgi:hypothetical protein
MEKTVVRTAAELWCAAAGQKFVESLGDLANSLLPGGCDAEVSQLRAIFAQLIHTSSGRTPGHKDVRFTDFLKFFIRFGDVESPGIVNGVQAVLSTQTRPFFSPESCDEPSFFQGFHPQLDIMQAQIELPATSLYDWVIIQGKSKAHEFIAVKKIMECGSARYEESRFQYFAKLPAGRSERFHIGSDEENPDEFVRNWGDVLTALDLPAGAGLVIGRTQQHAPGSNATFDSPLDLLWPDQ